MTEPTQIAQGPEQAIAAPSTKVLGPFGRPIKQIDLNEIRKLAALGMPQHLICEGLGISTDTFQRRCKSDAAFAEAFKDGLHSRRVKVLKSLADGMDKSFIPAIFMAKQPHILGFQDVQRKEYGGEIKLTIERQVLTEKEPAIEIEAEKV